MQAQQEDKRMPEEVAVVGILFKEKDQADEQQRDHHGFGRRGKGKSTYRYFEGKGQRRQCKVKEQRIIPEKDQQVYNGKGQHRQKREVVQAQHNITCKKKNAGNDQEIQFPFVYFRFCIQFKRRLKTGYRSINMMTRMDNTRPERKATPVSSIRRGVDGISGFTAALIRNFCGRLRSKSSFALS